MARVTKRKYKTKKRAAEQQKKTNPNPAKPKTNPNKFTLCVDCSRGTAKDCLYMRLKDPMKGLAAMGIDLEDVIIEERVVKDNKNVSHTMNIIQVIHCPHYKPGPLPPVNWTEINPAAHRIKK